MIAHMKTTIEIDDDLLGRVMVLTGAKTRRAAVDYALRTAEKQARLALLVREAPLSDAFKDAVDSNYDVIALREQERPKE